MNGEHAITEPTTVLVPVEHTPPARLPIEHDIELLGRAMVSSGYFKDTKVASQAIVKILAGKEIGLPPIASMTGIHVIDGKVTLGANLIAAVIKRSARYNYRVREHSDKGCRIEFFEDRESVGISEFTMADAERAGLAHKPVWRQYPRNLLFARALTNGARWYCADVFGGAVYTEEELSHDEAHSYVVQSAQIDNQTTAPESAPVVQDADAAPPTVTGECRACHADSELHAVTRLCLDTAGCKGRAGAIKAAPVVQTVTLPPADDEPPSSHDATLAADLDAAFQRDWQGQAPPRYPKTSQGQKAFLDDCRGKLGLEMDDIQAALGGTVAAYMKAQGVTLDEVYTVLVNKALDNEAVPGRLGAVAAGAEQG